MTHFTTTFDHTILTPEDERLARHFLTSCGQHLNWPDLVICASGDKPYLYRWHLLVSEAANVYLHIQVDSDPERPLHDHPWDNQSVILAGGYEEVMGYSKITDRIMVRRPGDVISRIAAQRHRLILPDFHEYSMSLFTTGPKYREWGFHFPDGWRPWTDVLTENDEGVSRWSPA